MISGLPVITTCWQKEWVRDVSRTSRPTMPGKTWRSLSTRDTSATGTLSSRLTSRAKRSMSVSAVAERPAIRSASNRVNSRIKPPSGLTLLTQCSTVLARIVALERASG